MKSYILSLLIIANCNAFSFFYKSYKNIEYARYDTTSIKLDLYVPDTTISPKPVIVWIHGGAWVYGDKEEPLALYLAAHGYAVVSINYRLAPTFTYPSQIQDCKTAIRWIRANASTYNLDGSRIGVWGTSSGAHLACLLGTSNGIKDYRIGNVQISFENDLSLYSKYSSDVQAVCDWYGNTDFSLSDQSSTVSGEALFIGGALSAHPEMAKMASPLTYVNNNSASFLIVHGELDNVVDIKNSSRLDSALKNNNVSSFYIPLKKTGHGGNLFYSDSIRMRVMDFFDSKFKPKFSGSTPDWKKYFTIDPDQGKSFVVDTTPYISFAGSPVLTINNNENIILSYSSWFMYNSPFILMNNGDNKNYDFNAVNHINSTGALIYLPDGRYRFIYEEFEADYSLTRHKSHLASQISNDGINFIKEEGIRFNPTFNDDSITSNPTAIQINDSTWRMYYVSDEYKNQGIKTALSTNFGLSWHPESQTNILKTENISPLPLYLSNNEYRLYFRINNKLLDSTQTGIAFCDSKDGINFDPSQSKLIITDSSGLGFNLTNFSLIRYLDGSLNSFIGLTSKYGYPVTRIIRALPAKKTNIEDQNTNNITAFNCEYNNLDESLLIKIFDSNFIYCNYRIFDLEGRIAASGSLYNKENIININNLKNQFYLLKINTPQNYHLFKFVK
ncbi:MAG: alpha/beta hydrolase [Candidatus Kapabacteria bacterium]|nr:alpha/beta hydrolase [Candidatus Kapabacteria bacterium]